MEENKEEILANFQSITGIDDIGEAFSHLEETNWDLMLAIQRVLPQDDELPSINDVEPEMATRMNGREDNTTTTNAPLNNFSKINSTQTATSSNNCSRVNSNNSSFATTTSTASADIIDLTSAAATSSASADIIDLTSDIDLDAHTSSSSLSTPKMLLFRIHFQQEIYDTTMLNVSTIEQLKNKICNLTGVPLCRQAIRGWPPAKQREAQKPNTQLSTLGLSAENDLILIDITEEGYVDYENSDEVINRLTKTFTITIVQQPSGIQSVLKLPGCTTIQELKMNVYHVTDIQVRHQEWVGWPNGCNNKTTLAQSGIELAHNFILNNAADKLKKNNATSNERANATNETDSSDEFEDASDFNACEDFFSDSPPLNSIANRHLIPNNTDDEFTGSIQFSQNYTQRFGEPHPVFYTGSLENALNQACHRPARERKLLAIYLHHGESIFTNVFCDHLMKHESIMLTFAQNFVLYGWDLTFESNKHLFLSSLTACVSDMASLTARNIPIDKLPSILVIGRSRLSGRTTCEVLSVIHGNVGLDDLLSRLIEAVEMYNEHIQVEIREEDERAARDQVKEEQDKAYQATLQADMAKEAAKQQEKAAIAAEKERIESAKAIEQAKREAIRLNAEQLLPEEPTTSDTEISKIRIRKPTGEFLERLFYQNNKLQDVLNFVTAHGFLIEEYKLISSWPRRDLTTLDVNDTLHTLKLYPQETLILQER